MGFQPFCELKRHLGLTFPDGQDSKATTCQSLFDLNVSSLVAFELGAPLLLIMTRHRPALAGVLMPEAAMNLHDPSV